MQIPKDIWSGIESQPHYMGPSKLWFKTFDKHND